MRSDKNGIQISVENKDIEISSKTFEIKFNFDNLSFLHMYCEQEAYAEEMEIKLEKVEEFHPELKDKLRIAFHTPEISCMFTAARTEGDKIARLNDERFKEMMFSGTPRNFHKEHEEFLEKLRSEDGVQEISYPLYFHACGYAFDDEDDEKTSSSNKESIGSARF